ncbi:unnamed protein product, partial [Ilex paraguariensis]
MPRLRRRKYTIKGRQQITNFKSHYSIPSEVGVNEFIFGLHSADRRHPFLLYFGEGDAPTE